jgi:hypothetical protein
MPARLPTTLKPTIETMIANGIACVDNKPATLSFVVTADSIKANPTAWSLFTLSG